ncbi:MAG: dihydropteroate synthase [Planctomycetaceae bacterium]|jgi:dihydropteroate synthase|nr:dihydropteroate synthase [Planctomycetaceae bacterium]
MSYWRLRTQKLNFNNEPLLMGIINVTPDSFSDGGQFYRNKRLEVSAAVDYALRLVEEGAAILDVGAESTQPGSQRIDETEELRRLVPVVAAIHEKTTTPISVDTYRAAAARESIAAGAEIVNDISAATDDPEMLSVLCETRAGVCLMHKQGMPQTMQKSPRYNDVVAEVAAYLEERKQTLIRAGIMKEKITLDPGIGFGKSPEHNFRLLRETKALHALESPLLYGVSRKRFIDALTGTDNSRFPKNRLPGTLAVTIYLALRGVQIFRVHDVAATRQALAVAKTLWNSNDDQETIPFNRMK